MVNKICFINFLKVAQSHFILFYKVNYFLIILHFSNKQVLLYEFIISYLSFLFIVFVRNILLITPILTTILYYPVLILVFIHIYLLKLVNI